MISFIIGRIIFEMNHPIFSIINTGCSTLKALSNVIYLQKFKMSVCFFIFSVPKILLVIKTNKILYKNLQYISKLNCMELGTGKYYFLTFFYI